jgi:hypothetical protein
VKFLQYRTFYGEGLLDLATLSLEGHPLSDVRDYLLNIPPHTAHVWRQSPSFATRDRTMLRRQGTYVTCLTVITGKIAGRQTGQNTYSLNSI